MYMAMQVQKSKFLKNVKYISNCLETHKQIFCHWTFQNLLG